MRTSKSNDSEPRETIRTTQIGLILDRAIDSIHVLDNVLLRHPSPCHGIISATVGVIPGAADKAQGSVPAVGEKGGLRVMGQALTLAHASLVRLNLILCFQ